MLRECLSSALAAATLLPAAAAAQQAGDTARVAPVVVTATRSPLRTDRVPASVSVITGAALRAQGVVHLADALRQIPGVAVVQSGSYGAPASLFVRGGQSNYTKVLIDGVPANDPGGAFDFGTLTVDDVERIEVVRGPASVVWGSDAMSAVVHVITRRGAANRGALALRAGTYGTVDVTGSSEGGRGPLRGALTGAWHGSDGSYRMNSDYRTVMLGGSTTWIGGRAGELRLGARYADLTAHFPTDFTGAPVDPNSYRDEERVNATAEWLRTIGRVDARLAAGHTLVGASSVNPADADGGTSTSFDTRTRRQQVELRLQGGVGPGVTLTGGAVAEWQHRRNAFNSVTGGQGSAAGGIRDASAADRRNAGAFTELLVARGATTATVGARIDHNGAYGDFGTWRVAASHHLLRATRVRASVGTAFREPSFEEALPSSFSTGNADIRPERSTSWEAGLEQGFAQQRLTVGATYFDQRFTDMIDYFAETFPGRYENVAKARANGIEAEARLVPHARWSVDGSLTRLWTRVESAGFGSTLADGRSLLRRPGTTGTLGVAYGGPVEAGLRVARVGARDDVRFFTGAPYSAEERMPAFTRVDLSASVPLFTRAGRSVAFTLRVDNALDEAYEAAAGYRAPGRVVLTGLRAGF